MSRREFAPSVRIIDHKKYILEKRSILCEINIRDHKLFVDFQSKTKRLYYPNGKEFILETISDMTDSIIETKIISKKEAMAFMDKHPYGINEKVYKRYFGEPEDI